MCKHILFNNFNIAIDLPLLADFAARSEYENDGFGYILRTDKGGIEWMKSICLAEFYLQLGQRLSAGDVKTLVVHHRTSTNKQGVDYAHPFEFNGHYLTHNGVVQVPGKHNTETSNDSEALLHHLIKTQWDTETISGYFSCFVLTHNTTTVLVDDIAPIYSNGRVFSSHKLSDDMQSIMLEKIVFDVNGLEISREYIKTTKTNYGLDKRSLSLGSGSGKSSPGAWDYESNWLDLDNSPQHNDKINLLLDCLSQHDIREIMQAGSAHRQIQAIISIGETLGLDLSQEDAVEALDLFDIA